MLASKYAEQETLSQNQSLFCSIYFIIYLLTAQTRILCVSLFYISKYVAPYKSNTKVLSELFLHYVVWPYLSITMSVFIGSNENARFHYICALSNCIFVFANANLVYISV